MSVGEAFVLLQHAASQGKPVPPAVADPILATVRSLDQQDIPAELERAFWPALAELTRVVTPVTAERLRYTTQYMSGNAHRRSIFFAYFVLFLLIVVQAHWFIGNTILENMKEIQVRLTQMTPATAPPAAAATAAPNATAASAVATGPQEANDRERLVMALAGYASALYTWGGWVWDRFGVEPQGEDHEGSVPLPEELQNKSYFGLHADYFHIIQSSQVYLQVVSQYILPVLYGALGAVVFRMRNITVELDRMTYSRSASIRSGFRFCLGGIAGLAIGWFLAPDLNPIETALPGSSIIPASLTSLALAFLAGYSVDLLFAVLDRLIAAVPAAPPAPAAPATPAAPVQA
jgi:hypothetical protein